MNKLQEKSLHTLEYHAVLELLAAHAVSQEGKERALALRPKDDLFEIEPLMRQVSDAKRMMEQHGSPALDRVQPVAALVGRAQRGGVLGHKELLAVAALMRSARRVKQYGDGETADSLSPLFALLGADAYLEERIGASILSEEEMADGASSQLLSIRRKMRQMESRMRETLNQFISSPATSKYLQDNLITMRGDRYVVPVKSEHRGEVAGLIHDVSSSGATVFVEPAAVVQAGNEIRMLQAEEKAEMERILSELTAEVAAQGEQLLTDYDCLCQLDVIFAKAKLSFALKCVEPRMVEAGETVLKRARHPLLPQETAVPIDIAIGGAYDTLVITGPNTGGKTVSLKTLGLLTLMACTGLHIPAGEESQVAVCERVLADIGDEQSIEQSLSTFSAHMKNIVSILAVCRKGDLVLFDELGAGTDPTEGAALAVAIIEFTRQMCARVAATTHYAELKVFALTTPGVENASCEFDVQTLRPTYRLLTGVPGKSNAFAISKRLGLPQSVIDRAQEHIGEESAKMEDVLTRLEKQRLETEKYRQEADAFKRMAQSEKDKLAQLTRKAEQQQQEEMRRASEQAQRILAQARRAAEEVMEKVTALQKKSAEQLQKENLEKARAELWGSLSEAEKKAIHKKAEKARRRQPAGPLRPGDTVELINVGTRGTVLTAPDAQGNLQVQAGILKITVREDEVRPVQGETPAHKAPRPQPRRTAPAPELSRRSAQTELDLRGLDTQEAILELDRFLSAAVMANLHTATIIHGKGTGALRAAVQQHLKRHPKVKSQRPGRYGEGEMGVTIIELK